MRNASADKGSHGDRTSGEVLHADRIWATLYLGDRRAASCADRGPARRIVNVTLPDQVPNVFEGRKGWRYLRVPVSHAFSPESARAVARVSRELCEFIDRGIEKGEVVLVHCEAGVSRSASIVCGYLMWKLGWGFARSCERTKGKRPRVRPTKLLACATAVSGVVARDR